MSAEAAVRMTGITKRFGAFTALEGVDLVVRNQTIHAVVGENGAGKTTLMKVLQGLHAADAGTLELDGKTVSFRRAEDAYRSGIGMVSQHYSIIPELTCLQNLMLGSEPGPLLDQSQAKERATRVASELGLSFDWDALAETLGPAGSQKLEILKLLWRESRIMILDEPTAMLSPADSDALYANLKGLVERGATVIVVTHRLPEVLEYCDDVTVLRGGKKIAAMATSETDAATLANLIVGRALDGPSDQTRPEPGEVVLELKGVRVLGDRGDEALRGVDLTVRAGEMVGLAGVDGSGQRELFRLLWGVARPVGGTLTLFGQDASNWSVRERIARGLRLVAEDRLHEGVVESWSLHLNGQLGFQRHPDREDSPQFTEELIQRFRTKARGIGDRIASLSGGNQQRFVVARALALDPELILAFQPTRGLDIAATEEIFGAMRAHCAAGAAALVVSFDLDDLIDHCDRVVAMNRGRIHTPAVELGRDRAELGRLMVTT